MSTWVPDLRRRLHLPTVAWMHGTQPALSLIISRVMQGIGGAFLFANSAAILTDALPATSAVPRSA